MANAKEQELTPPKLSRGETGEVSPSALADLLEWFLIHDERTARVRHPNTDELFQWKQTDDEANGIGIYPFENAEARFAVGAFQALSENNTEPLLREWITDILEALGRARETRTELTAAYNLDAEAELFSLQKAEKLTTATERRLYLSSCWLEALCTAEARFLGWVYQDIYGKPFEPV